MVKLISSFYKNPVEDQSSPTFIADMHSDHLRLSNGRYGMGGKQDLRMDTHLHCYQQSSDFTMVAGECVYIHKTRHTGYTGEAERFARFCI